MQVDIGTIPESGGRVNFVDRERMENAMIDDGAIGGLPFHTYEFEITAEVSSVQSTNW